MRVVFGYPYIGLSVSDLGSLTSMILTNVFYTPAVSIEDLPFEPLGVIYLTNALPHLTFARITSWITAFVTLERCLCITAPLKVVTQRF